MSDLIELRRLKPTVSLTHPYMFTTNELFSDYSDEETFPTLPIIHRKHDVFIEPLPSPYIPMRSFATVYQHVHSPTLIEERPLYRSSETPVRRIVPIESSEKNVHLPKHAKKLVNRFLNNLQQAHDHQHTDGNESDCSIDDCEVCRQLRSAMNNDKRRNDLYHSNRILFETQNSSKYQHSNDCQICHLLENSDFGISNTKKQDQHVHVIKTFSSNNPSRTDQVPLYPTRYTTFIDPNTGFTYAYDPNWQYGPNPPSIPNNSPYTMPNTIVPVVTNSSYPSTMDKSTYTRIPSDDKNHKSNDPTVIVHTSRNPTPRTPKIIIEQPRRRHRVSRKKRSRTIVTERIPRTKTTTYI